MKKWFIGIDYIDWGRMALVVGTVAILWGGISALVPAKYHAPIMAVLTAVQSAITFAMRGSKYVAPRQEIPPPDED